MVAGAGFGKSVALGQALRANRARPRGVEGWLSCRSGCESPDRLAAAVEAAFGVPAGRGPALDRLYAVFADLAPLHAALVLDDAELLPAGAAAAVDDLLRRAPSNLHLVLCGRRLPPLALARFRAADDIVEVGADDLRFDDAEVAALAASLGADPPATDLGGWPALVRLALVAHVGAVDDFLWEEVDRGRSTRPTGRRCWPCACSGRRGPDEVEAVTGVPFDPDGFCDRVPLVHRGRATRSWPTTCGRRYVAALGSAAEVAAMSQRVLAAVADRGDAVATGSIALRLGDHEALRRAAVDLVRTTLGSLPESRWPRPGWRRCAAPDGGGDRPEVELLACALAHARSAAEPPAGRLDDASPPGSGTRATGRARPSPSPSPAWPPTPASDVAHLVVSLAQQARSLADEDDSPAAPVAGRPASTPRCVAIGSGDLDAALGAPGPAGGGPCRPRSGRRRCCACTGTS